MECDKEKTQSLYAAALPHYKEYPDARGQWVCRFAWADVCSLRH